MERARVLVLQPGVGVQPPSRSGGAHHRPAVVGLPRPPACSTAVPTPPSCRSVRGQGAPAESQRAPSPEGPCPVGRSRNADVAE